MLVACPPLRTHWRSLMVLGNSSAGRILRIFAKLRETSGKEPPVRGLEKCRAGPGMASGRPTGRNPEIPRSPHSARNSPGKSAPELPSRTGNPPAKPEPSVPRVESRPGTLAHSSNNRGNTANKALRGRRPRLYDRQSNPALLPGPSGGRCAGGSGVLPVPASRSLNRHRVPPWRPGRNECSGRSGAGRHRGGIRCSRAAGRGRSHHPPPNLLWRPERRSPGEPKPAALYRRDLAEPELGSPPSVGEIVGPPARPKLCQPPSAFGREQCSKPPYSKIAKARNGPTRPSLLNLEALPEAKPEKQLQNATRMPQGEELLALPADYCRVSVVEFFLQAIDCFGCDPEHLLHIQAVDRRCPVRLSSIPCGFRSQYRQNHHAGWQAAKRSSGDLG